MKNFRKHLYKEEDLLPLSSLQHFLFCPRQCALIHVERIWVENIYTAEGRILHERVHQIDGETRKRVRTAYALPLVSYTLGVAGVADVVEFHISPGQKWKKKTPPGPNILEKIVPVEYKRGRAKKGDFDEVQLCAQAVCLEEMINFTILYGDIYYGKTKRRKKVTFDEDLRKKTKEAADKLHAMFESGKTPPPPQKDKILNTNCDACSLKSACLPKVADLGEKSAHYIKEMTENE